MKLLFTAAILFLSIVKVQAQETPAPDTLIIENVIFEKVTIETGVSEEKWRQLLGKHMVPLIKKARKKLQAGSHTINVRFLKEKDGSISDVKALNDPGYGLAEGAWKVVINWPSGPKWNPGGGNGSGVRTYHTQRITFQIHKKK